MEFVEVDDIELCFPLLNLSCVKEVRPSGNYVLMYVFFSSVSFFTVLLNLLVILSISHFKQLHTPTNMLIFSLAVSDLLIGMIVIPLESIKLIETCWYFGETMCSVFQAIVFTVIFSSLYNLVLIAIDRYFSVYNPLLYCTEMTIEKMLISIFLIWTYSLIYNLLILNSNTQWNDGQSAVFCHGECMLLVSFTWGIVDLVFSFVVPCSIIICLYIKIFKVAKSQAQAINCISSRVNPDAMIEMSKKSERKATKTLGIVVLVYLICWITHYVCVLLEDFLYHSSDVIAFLSWVLYINSCLNPLIYALFYPWFKISARHILTLRFLAPSSSFLNLYPEKN